MEATNEQTRLYPPLAGANPEEESTELDSTELILGPSTTDRPRPRAATDVTDPVELAQIQALELAANRAEISRQQRELDELRRAIRLREGWLEDLRMELDAAREDQRNLTAQLSEARDHIEQVSKKMVDQAAQISQLEAQLAERMSATVFASAAPRTRPMTESLNVDRPARLQPLDDESPPIDLNRRVMTIGRTRESDICVPSALVSRDHARILVNDDGVVLFDVGSINGSFVNERLVRKEVLQDGDVLRFADRRYKYCE